MHFQARRRGRKLVYGGLDLLRLVFTIELHREPAPTVGCAASGGAVVAMTSSVLFLARLGMGADKSDGKTARE